MWKACTGKKSISHCSAVVRATIEPYGDRQIFGYQDSKTIGPIDQKFGMGDDVGDNSPLAKIQNDRGVRK